MTDRSGLSFTSNGIAIGGNTANVIVDIAGANDAVALPVGHSTERPPGQAGFIRYNSDLAQFEGFSTAWGPLGGVATANATGFYNRTNSTISLNVTSRVFNISPNVGSTFNVYVNGAVYTKNSNDTITLTNANGSTIIYYDANGVLQSSFIGNTNLDFSTYLNGNAVVSLIYYNATLANDTIFTDERHGLVMDWATINYIEQSIGSAYISGLGIQNFTTVGTGAANADAQVGFANGVIADADIFFNITDGAPQTISANAQLPVIYQSGAEGNWTKDIATPYPVKQGAARIQYNLNTANVWSTVDAGTTNYVAMWVLGTNDVHEPIIAVLGQRQETKLTDAQANNTFLSLNFVGFPYKILRPLYRLIFQTATGYVNVPHARLADVLDIRRQEVVTTTVSSGGGGGAYLTDLYANGTLVLANATSNFNNTATVNVSLTANGTGQVNIALNANVAAIAGPAYAQANAAYGQANAAYGQANSAYTQANNAYGQANSAYTQANNAYAQANSAYNQANGAFDKANSSGNTVATFANGSLILANANVNFNNTATINVAASANGTTQSNIAFTVNVSSTDWASGANGTAQSAYAQANAAYAEANSSGNTVAVYANGTVVLTNANVNFNNTATVNVSATANGTTQANVAFTVNTAAMPLGVNVAQNSGTIVANSILMTFNNTGTVNATVQANGTGKANVSFSVNTSTLSQTTITSDYFVATANQKVFTLSSNVVADRYVFVARNGVEQVPTLDYTTANNVLTFTSNCIAGTVVEARNFNVGNVTVTAGTTRVQYSNVVLGTQAVYQGDYTYYTVTPVMARGLITLLQVTANVPGLFDIVVRGNSNNNGVLYLQATDIFSNTYTMSYNFYYISDDLTQNLYIGIKNRGGVPQSYNLSSFNAERFA